MRFVVSLTTRVRKEDLQRFSTLSLQMTGHTVGMNLEAAGTQLRLIAEGKSLS
jgi:hypothetical protein